VLRFYIVSTMDLFPKIYHWLITLKSKITNNFKIFHIMLIRCVMKVASTLKYVYIYITYCHTDKLEKLIKLVFKSQLVSSAAMHVVGFFCLYS
jgi:hypothetical protein